MNLRASTSHKNKCGKIVYADHAIRKWFALGLDDDGQFPPNIHLEPISNEYLERKTGEKPLALVNSVVTEEACKPERNCSKSPWEIIAENVHQELLSSFEILRKEMDDQGSEKVKPTLIAGLGKFLFHGNPSMRLQSVNKIQVEEAILRQLYRSLYNNIPSSYMENIVDGVVPAIGVDFEEEKDVYAVKAFLWLHTDSLYFFLMFLIQFVTNFSSFKQLSDNTRPDATVFCKCILLENKKLHLYKVELNQVRQMVIDISCLDKNLDLRLMLCSRKILTALTDDEMNSLRDLISSAVLDSDMKGGLKWPLGKASSDGRYRVVGAWHTITKVYRSSSFRLKARDADRYDFRTGIGETTREVYLKLKRIVSEIQEPGAASDSISKMLEDSLRLIWEKFLCCERVLT